MHRLTAALCFVCLGSAQAADVAAQTAQELRAVDNALGHNAAQQDAATVYGNFMDPVEGLAFTGEGQPARGGGITTAIGREMTGLRLRWVVESAWGSRGGDMGVTTGAWAATKTGDTAPLVTGLYVTVWRRNAAGAWKGLINIGQPDAKPVANAATR